MSNPNAGKSIWHIKVKSNVICKHPAIISTKTIMFMQNKFCILIHIGEFKKLLKNDNVKAEVIVSWKYVAGDITSRAVHLLKYPQVGNGTNYVKE